jgi:hypothetical protein
MKRIRASLSYSNVVATLALFLALTGGAVWAADKITSKQIGKGAVKSKNLAKNAVKTKNLAKNAVKKKNLAKNAVTTNKLAKGAVKSAKLGDGAVNFAKIAPGTNVIASATGGPVPVTQDSFVNIPLSAPLSVTSVAGQILMLNIEGRASLTASGMEQCFAAVVPFVNGTPRLTEDLFLVAPQVGAEPPFDKGVSSASTSFPLGMTQPGTPQNITLQVVGDETDCAAGSRIDQVAVVVTQAK